MPQTHLIEDYIFSLNIINDIISLSDFIKLFNNSKYDKDTLYILIQMLLNDHFFTYRLINEANNVAFLNVEMLG